MGKVNGLFQDAEEQAFDRYTNILVDADVEIMFHHGKPEPTKIRIKDIPCLWVWDETSREAAEYWAVWDYVGATFTFDWMSIKSWSGSPVKVDTPERIN